ncbi:MAG TPA: type 4a pilus biogenesis protein PilO [candidate division Zixibacteria bacterium]|nr:type 4a pilus biogenesis protein PilO [candidate division Zixibacteria bacterium]
MDFKDSNTQKILLGAMAFFIVVYFWYSRLYSKYDHMIETKSQEFERITTDLRNVELKAKSLDALKLEYQDLLGRYHQIEALLPEVKQIPSFLVQLHTASSLTGTKITGIQPLPTEGEEFYNIASFEINMTGTYHDMGKFIGYVANFPFIANVSDMQLTALEVAISGSEKSDDMENTMQKRETVAATFNLSTYYVKENERLKEITL